jgi:hypothetical protein
VTKKDFVLIAHALRRSRPGPMQQRDALGQWEYTRDTIMGMIALAHPRFDAERFRRATEA